MSALRERVAKEIYEKAGLKAFPDGDVCERSWEKAWESDKEIARLLAAPAIALVLEEAAKALYERHYKAMEEGKRHKLRGDDDSYSACLIEALAWQDASLLVRALAGAKP